MAHGLSCSAAWGIFPDQGLNPCPLHWQVDSQPLRHPGSPCIFLIISDVENFHVLFLAFFYPVPHQLNESIIISLLCKYETQTDRKTLRQDMKPLRWPFIPEPREPTPVFYQNTGLAKFPPITETHLSVGKEPEQRASASSIGSPRLLSFSCLFNSDGARVETSTSQRRKRFVTKKWQLYPLSPAIWRHAGSTVLR